MKTGINKVIAFSLGLVLTGMYLLTPNALAQQLSTPDTAVVKVLGTAEDARFEPADLQIQAGDVIRFEVMEGLHTVTAYHPDNRRPLRMPAEAASFDSGPLQAGAIWFLQLKEEGTYNYFCLPHERFGHVGRITVKYSEDSTAEKAEAGPFSLAMGNDLKKH